MPLSRLFQLGPGSMHVLPIVRWFIASVVLTLVTACGADLPPAQSGADPVPHDPDVVARFGEIEIKADELDAQVAMLPVQDRPPPGADLDAWFRSRIREFVIDRHLLIRARASISAHADPMRRARDAAQGQAEVQLCLKARMADMEPFDRADLEQEFEQARELLKKPERRLTQHIFRRISDTTTRQAAIEELSGLRDRVLNGESFSRLAGEHSDSESRHRKGELGWLVRGELPSALDQLVFELQEGVPSQPVAVPEGVHIFFVQSVSTEREITLIEAMPTLRERMQSRRIGEVLQAIAEQDGRDFNMPDHGKFEALLKGGDPASVLLQDGDFKLDLADFRILLRQVSNRAAEHAQGAVPLGAAWQLLGTIRAREQLRSACREAGWIAQEDLAAHLQSWEERYLINAQRNQELIALAKSSEQRLRQYYTQNVEQFSTPVRWSLKRLRLPLDAGSGEVMAVLEAAARRGVDSVEALQTKLGGRIEELPGQHLENLGGIAPMLPGLIAPLKVGQLSAPLRTAEHLEIYQLMSRAEPMAAPFEDIREQVASVFARHHAADLYRTYGEALFESKPLEIFPEALAQLVSSGLPEPEISAEALDRMLEAL